MRSVFFDVHAAAKNGLNLFAACGRQTLRGFFKLKKGAGAAVRAFFALFWPAMPGQGRFFVPDGKFRLDILGEILYDTPCCKAS